MNPNFDFRSDEVWDDRPINSSIGDDLEDKFDDMVAMMCLVVFLICCLLS